jgi:hypothetical protein
MRWGLFKVVDVNVHEGHVSFGDDDLFHLLHLDYYRGFLKSLMTIGSFEFLND